MFDRRLLISLILRAVLCAALPFTGVSADSVLPNDAATRDLSLEELREVWAYYTGFEPTAGAEIVYANVTDKPEGTEWRKGPFKYFSIRLATLPILRPISRNSQKGRWGGLCSRWTYDLSTFRDEPPPPMPQVSDTVGVLSYPNFALPAEDGTCVGSGPWVDIRHEHYHSGVAYFGLTTTQIWQEALLAGQWTCEALADPSECVELTRLLKGDKPPVYDFLTFERGPGEGDPALISRFWLGASYFNVRFEWADGGTYEVHKIDHINRYTGDLVDHNDLSPGQD